MDGGLSSSYSSSESEISEDELEGGGGYSSRLGIALAKRQSVTESLGKA